MTSQIIAYSAAAGMQFIWARRAGIPLLATAGYIGVSSLTTLVASYYFKNRLETYDDKYKNSCNDDLVREFQARRRREFPRDSAVAIFASYVLAWIAGSSASAFCNLPKCIPLPLGTTFIMNGMAFATHALVMLASKNFEKP